MAEGGSFATAHFGVVVQKSRKLGSVTKDVKKLLGDQDEWCTLPGEATSADTAELKFPGFVRDAGNCGKLLYIPNHLELP